MANEQENSGLKFNKYGFADVALPANCASVGNIRAKVSIYCPAKNENSESVSEVKYPGVNFSKKRGDDYDNMTFTLDELQLLQIKTGDIIAELQKVA